MLNQRDKRIAKLEAYVGNERVYSDFRTATEMRDVLNDLRAQLAAAQAECKRYKQAIYDLGLDCYGLECDACADDSDPICEMRLDAFIHTTIERISDLEEEAARNADAAKALQGLRSLCGRGYYSLSIVGKHWVLDRRCNCGCGDQQDEWAERTPLAVVKAVLDAQKEGA